MILLATPSIDDTAGGPAYSVPAIGRSLLASGLEARLLVQHGRQRLAAAQSGSLSDLRSADVVHNFGVWTAFNHGVARAARWLRRPLVMAPLGMLEPWALGQKSLKKRAGLWLYQRSDLERAAVLHATSPDEAQHLRRLAPGVPIAMIPHGVDLPESTRTAAPAGREPRVALFMSRIHPKKGLVELAQAWARVRPQGWRVVVAGPDEVGHRAEVEAELQRLHIEFEFVGDVRGEAKRRLLERAELFVLPTFSENFGLVVAEALAHGVPVITTHGAPWQALAQTASGWWIETGVDALVVALHDALARTPTQLFEMGQRGQQLIREHYSWSSRGAKYRELYAWLGGGARPSFVV